MFRLLGWCLVLVLVGYWCYYRLDDPGTRDAAYCAPATGPGVVQAAVPGVPNVPLPLPWLAPKVAPHVPDLIPHPVSPWVAVPEGLGRLVRRVATDPPSTEAVSGFVQGVFERVTVAVGVFGATVNDAPDPKVVTAFKTQQQQAADAVQVSACSCSPAAQASDGAQLARVAALAAGFTGQDLEVAVAVAGAESDWVPTATNPRSSARGMWQIMLSAHPGIVAGKDWRDPYQNAQMAYAVWRDAGGWSPWTTYTSGAYKKYLATQDAPAAQTVGVCTGGGVVLAGAPVPGLCPVSGSPAEKGLTPSALTVLRCGAAAFPQVTSFGGVGPRGNVSDHPSGRAVDFMVPDWQAPAGQVLGTSVAKWFVRYGTDLDVAYVIWGGRVNSLDGRGWRPYVNPQCSSASRCGATLQHLDHVHVSVNAGRLT